MKFLVIQTAFIGDVILATSILEKLHEHYPDAQIDFLLRKGNESLFDGHPYLNNVLIWDKNRNKVKNLINLIKIIRKTKYDYVINVHRHLSSGIITVLSGAVNAIGFDKNPLSFLFTRKVKHIIGTKDIPIHEVDRNNGLISAISDNLASNPKLYPTEIDSSIIEKYKIKSYICIAPKSVWYSKKLSLNKWVELIEKLPNAYNIYLLGASTDRDYCDYLRGRTNCKNVYNLCGELTLLQSAALMKGSKMNYVNDSASLHLSSSVNGPTTAIFCSTIPEFGFYPLSTLKFVIETPLKLTCRPCGIHGYDYCKLGHFLCSQSIEINEVIDLGIHTVIDNN
ncbi:MAG: glycosyltransferase family 9 protein [Bacteroidota bacterium]